MIYVHFYCASLALLTRARLHLILGASPPASSQGRRSKDDAALRLIYASCFAGVRVFSRLTLYRVRRLSIARADAVLIMQNRKTRAAPGI
jgi:hypothetical protein